MKLTRGKRQPRSWRHPWEDLEDIDYFSVLSHEARRKASRHVDRVDVAEGVVLQRQGMAARWLWIPESGLLQLRRDGEAVGLVLPGASYGERELLVGGPSRVDVVTAWPSTVLSISAPAWHALMDVPSFAAAVARRMAHATVPAGSRVNGDQGTVAV
jgi:CRP-like cAMP-binding protein